MTREELRKKIPHGALKEVALYAQVSTQAVYKYFNHRINSYKIEVAALKVAIKYGKEKDTLLKEVADEKGITIQ